MSARPDPLHALDQADAALATAGLTPNDIFREELRQARADIAALLEADREYDIARASTDALRDGISTLGEVVTAERLLAEAKLKRAAALAKFGEPK